jgi:rod shape determining protein RodA
MTTTAHRPLDTRRLLDNTRRILATTQTGRTDWIAPVCMIILSITGLFFIYSAQYYSVGNLWTRQLMWLFIGGGVYVVVSRIDYKIFLENAFWFYLGALVLLFAVLAFGTTREGATRWLSFGPFTFQPSEGAKVGVLIMTASMLARSELSTVRESARVVGKVFFVMALPMVLILLQPDLGSTLIIPPMVLALLYVSKLSRRFFLVLFAGVFAGVALLAVDLYRYANFLDERGLTALEARGQFQEVSFLPYFRDYQRERIMTFVAPEVIDPRGTGSAWNAIQAQQAVGTGGLTGKGWREGLQARLGYLPRSVAHNDFIFAVLAEEKGFIGGVFVIGLFAILLANGIRIAASARDRFGMLLCMGVTVILFLHVFINIGMSIGITPITGLPLPFVSYGGSFILSCCILQGIVQSVNRHRREFQ